MATAAGTSSADSDTECYVCHELFKNPKLLPCAHVLCRHCLLSWLASNPEALCPLNKNLGWRFHTNHGKNIALSNDGLTAKRVRHVKDGIVVADQPMVPTVLYEIRIDTPDPQCMNRYMPCGVVLTDPDHLRLPDTAYGGWGSEGSEAVVIGEAVYIRGHKSTETNNLNGATLCLSEGTRVGVMVTTNAELHLWVNGSDQGVIAATVPMPCFAFFDLRGRFCNQQVISEMVGHCIAFHELDRRDIIDRNVKDVWNCCGKQDFMKCLTQLSQGNTVYNLLTYLTASRLHALT